MQGKISALLRAIAKLPGMNQRTSRKMCFALLQNKEMLDNLLFSLQEVKSCVLRCKTCGMYTESEKEECSICLNTQRSRKYVCVVSDMMNLLAIEKTRAFDGVYHVLNGVISHLDQVGPEQLNIKSLVDRVVEQGVDRVLIGLSPTTEGQTTAYYLRNLLGEYGVEVNSLAVGVSIGSDLEYLDASTIAASIKNSIKL